MRARRDDSAERRTTPEYWDDSWSGLEAPRPVDPAVDTPENALNRALHARFARALCGRRTGDTLVEIGCGGSRWLPYFHLTFGYAIAGIDYSPEGLRLLELTLKSARIPARLVQGDLFEPPPDMVEAFDVVTSFGVIEHFNSTCQAVCACVRYLKPGGIMITEVPTMRGPYGMAYRVFRPSVYRLHVPQTRESLANAHREAGLDVLSSEYILGAPAVLTRPTPSTSLVRRIGFAIGERYHRLERAGWGIPPNRFTSPYALCIATKPTSST